MASKSCSCRPCAVCCKPIEKAFAVDRLDFKLDDSDWKEVFAKPGGCFAKCACNRNVFIAARVIIALVWLCCVIWSIADWCDGYAEFKYWLTKLTHWGAMFELVYFCFAAASTYMAIYGNVADGKGDATPWFVQATWFLASVVPCVAFLVCVLYWVLVFKPEDGSPQVLSVVMHGGNFALVLIDLLLCRQPFYIAHVYMPMLFGATYGLFTLVYYAAGGTFEDGVSKYIYAALDWSDPAGTGNLLGLIVLLVLPIVYCGCFCLVAARRKCRGTQEEATVV